MKKYETIKWLWQRISYWGDKLLTFGFYIVFGLFILSFRLIRWVKDKSLKGSLYVLRGIKSAYYDWRMARRIRKDFKDYGLRRKEI